MEVPCDHGKLRRSQNAIEFLWAMSESVKITIFSGNSTIGGGHSYVPLHCNAKSKKHHTGL